MMGVHFLPCSATYRQPLPELTIHRLSNAHPNGLPHWAELLETVRVASYEAPEAVLSQLNYIIDKSTFVDIYNYHVGHIWRLCVQLLKLGSIYEAREESKLIQLLGQLGSTD